MGFASFREDIVSRYGSGSQRPASKGPVEKPQTKQQGPVGGDQSKPKSADRANEFAVDSPRPLPVILMADVSGSMAADGKIDALNGAVAEMLATFAQEEEGRAEVQVAIVTFGGNEASVHVPLTRAKEVKWKNMSANGATPLGSALDVVTDLIEDRNQVPTRAYRPTIILVSDGRPEGEPEGKWEASLARLLAADRAKRAQRFAMAIGADALRGVLAKFLDTSEARIFEAHEAREIRKFFKWVTMSINSRTRSAQPDQVVDVNPLNIDDLGEF